MTAHLSRAAVAILPLAGGAGTRKPQAISNDIVKVGALTDMTGLFSDLAGIGAVTPAQMAIDDFVEKEKPPFNVELVPVDHRSKRDVATGIVGQWYHTGHVDMMTDVINSAAALVVSAHAGSSSVKFSTRARSSRASGSDSLRPSVVP